MKSKLPRTKIATRNYAIKRMEETIKLMKKLKPEQFNYSSYVCEFENREFYSNTLSPICGSVCCVAGWYPKWYGKKSGLKYSLSDSITPIKRVNISGIDEIKITLIKYHLLNERIIDILFYGDKYKIGRTKHGAADGFSSDLKQVIASWEKVLKDLKAGKLDEYLLKPYPKEKW